MHTFSWALQQLRAGKGVRRRDWGRRTGLQYLSGYDARIRWIGTHGEWNAVQDDLLASDWEPWRAEVEKPPFSSASGAFSHLSTQELVKLVARATTAMINRCRVCPQSPKSEGP